MSTVALGCVRSCGVTTLALALAASWPEGRDVLLVEADPAGGTLAADAGWPPEPGLVSFAAAARRVDDPSIVIGHCHRLPGGAPVLAAPASGEQAHHALALADPVLASIGTLDADVLIDCGRLESTDTPHGAPSLGRFVAADRALLVARPRLADLHALGSWLAGREARAIVAPDRLGLVIVGEGPYPDDEVTDALGVAVLGRVPTDPEAVDALLSVAASDRMLRRAPLVRAARSLAGDLAGPAPSAAPEPAPSRRGQLGIWPWRPAAAAIAVNGRRGPGETTEGVAP